MSHILTTFGMVCMNGSLLIGSIIATSVIGGTIVHGYQNNSVVLSDTVVIAGSASPRIVRTDTIVAPPVATTTIASDMTSSTATLHGVVYPRGEEISYWFEYSADPNLGLILIRKTPRVTLITSMKQRPVEANVSDLMKSTKYYFRIVTQDSNGTVRGAPVSFNTK